MSDQPQQQAPTPPSSSGCQPCDLGDIDELGCKAKRYQKQAEVMTQVAVDLDASKKQYAEAVTAFGEAWEQAAAERVAINELLEKIRQLLECRLSPEQKSCLDSSAEEVFEDLDDCLPAPGCCVGDCEFDDSVSDSDDAASLGDRIAAYRRTVEATTACFVSLVGEAGVLTARIAEIKAEVIALDTVISGPDNTKLPRWYARLLVAERDIQATHIGHGFTSVKDFVDCLCQALHCIAAGWAAIAVLEGARAELVCLEEARAKACTEKQTGVVAAILTAYECCIEDKEDTGSTGYAEQGEKPTYPASA